MQVASAAGSPRQRAGGGCGGQYQLEGVVDETQPAVCPFLGSTPPRRVTLTDQVVQLLRPDPAGPRPGGRTASGVRRPPRRGPPRGTTVEAWRDRVPVRQKRVCEPPPAACCADRRARPRGADGGYEPADAEAPGSISGSARSSAQVRDILRPFAARDVPGRPSSSYGGRAEDQGGRGHQRVEPADGVWASLGEERAGKLR